MQTAFYERYAAQCGFCTPGMLLAATALIERSDGEVDRDDVLEALGGHLPLHRLREDRLRGARGVAWRGEPA